VPGLIKVLDDPDPHVIKAGVLALGSMREMPATFYERTVKALGKLLPHGNPEVRECTVTSLVAIGGQESYNLLIRRMGKERDQMIRTELENGIEALKQQGLGKR
jgi:hypothetical protein